MLGKEGKLVNGTREEEKDTKIEKPLKGLKEAFFKLRNNVELNQNEINALIRMVDEFTTVSLHCNTVGEDVVKIAKDVNVHHHTKTCKKYNQTCRFDYPRYPSYKTVISKPLKGSKLEIDKKIKMQEEVLSKMFEIIQKKEVLLNIMNGFEKVKETKDEHNEFIKKRIQKLCDLAGVSMEEYMAALSISKRGYKVILKRDIDELFVNSYNDEWLRAWNGNMDLQICLDFFSVITYITDYYSKDETGTMKVINEALKQNECKDVKDKMKVISNTFLTSRQIGEAEAVYRLIPNMTLRSSNVTCQWVPTDPIDERSKRFKKATDDQMNSGIPVFQLEGHEGYYFEIQDIYSKYLRRPDSLIKCSFAQFSKMYRSKATIKKETDEAIIDDYGDHEDEIFNDTDNETLNKFDFIMTADDFTPKVVLPDVIVLKNVFPGEASTLRKRQFPASLRFHKVLFFSQFFFSEESLKKIIKKSDDFFSKSRMLKLDFTFYFDYIIRSSSKKNLNNDILILLISIFHAFLDLLDFYFFMFLSILF